MVRVLVKVVVMRQGLRFMVLIAHVMTKASLSPQLFKDSERLSGQSRTHDLPNASLMLKQLSQPVGGK